MMMVIIAMVLVMMIACQTSPMTVGMRPLR
jgi:hypothetical protein